jgi:hypothetical protein
MGYDDDGEEHIGVEDDVLDGEYSRNYCYAPSITSF